MSKRGYLRNEEKERYWRGVLRRHGKIGLSIREFCRGEDLKESAFYFWKRTIAERTAHHPGLYHYAPSRTRITDATVDLDSNITR